MAPKHKPEASESPLSPPSEGTFAQNDINSQITHVQTATDGVNYDLLTGSQNDVGEGVNARVPYHHSLGTGGSSHEQEDSLSFKSTSREQPQDPVGDEPSLRAKMWDPVKECSDPSATHADLPGFLPAGHNDLSHHNSSEQFMDITVRDVPSIDLHSSQGDQPYVQAQDSRQQLTNLGSRGAAPMGLLPYSQQHALASGYHGSDPMRYSSSLHTGHMYDQFRRRSQHQFGYGNMPILPPHLSESSRQNEQQSLESMTREAALPRMQPPQAGYLHGHSRENGQQHMVMGSRMPDLRVPRESARPYGSDSEQANLLQHQSPSVNMSLAIRVARYAETLDQQANYTEAVRAYKQACGLFQDVIIRSCSLEERMECDHARNTYQARLDVLSRRSARTASNKEDDQQEEDGLGRGKPQYSLSEDYALCQKEQDDLSWQEVAETAMFKGKRKHRSLSQRKHTISKMGPRYNGEEIPWTEEEDRKLCALGDAGKTLGDIHRKFRSRNAERCLNRYFQLKGYRTIGRHHPRMSHQARQDQAPYPLSSPSPNLSTVVARHQEHRLHPSTSVTDPNSHHHDFPPTPPTPGQNLSSVLTPRHETQGIPSSSSPFASTVPVSLNHATSTLSLTPGSPGSSDPSRQ